MEGIFFLLPWILCFILFKLWKKEKERRISEVDSAMTQAKEAEHRAFEESKKARMEAESEIFKVKRETASSIQRANLEAEELKATAMRTAEEKVAQAQARCRDEIDATRTSTYEEMARMRTIAEERIRETREAICANKEVLRSLSEKELAIECMAALNTYAYRLDRLENRMANMAIALDGVRKKDAKEKKPYAHVGVISDAELISIVQEATKRVGRITEWTVQEGIVRGLVISQHKLSTWAFAIDFNDDGQLTGNYTVFSENDASTIPQRLANDIAKEIVYRIKRN